jgi:aminotransferase
MNIRKDFTYTQCCNCVMDTSDPEIIFDERGVCNHCHDYENIYSGMLASLNESKLGKLAKEIKKYGSNKEFDCILGLSGGVDSSYLALIVKDLGLNPLVVHVDAGWNSEIAVSNIQKILDFCSFELETSVLNWNEVKDLQLAYLKSGIANMDAVQDHAFFAALYHYADKHNIKYVLSGGNITSESVLPKAWHHSAMDAINLKSIHKKFGSVPLKSFPMISFFRYFFWYPFVKKMVVIRPLNYIDYNKAEAEKVLVEAIGYETYGRKHGESRFTKFFQNYLLPAKFKIDKRIAHLSSLILSGQLSREDAVEKLCEPLYEEVELHNDKIFVSNKLGIDLDELNEIVNCAPVDYREYKNWDARYKLLKKVQAFIERFFGNKLSKYF